MWRWLIGGLTGELSMMLTLFHEGPPITAKEHESLLEKIAGLKRLADDLKARDLPEPEKESTDDHSDESTVLSPGPTS